MSNSYRNSRKNFDRLNPCKIISYNNLFFYRQNTVDETRGKVTLSPFGLRHATVGSVHEANVQCAVVADYPPPVGRPVPQRSFFST